MRGYIKPLRVLIITIMLIAVALCVGCVPSGVVNAGGTGSENEPEQSAALPPAEAPADETGAKTGVPTDETDDEPGAPEDWGAIYIQTLHSYLLQDTALNENIDYMAIDMSSLEYASAEEKERVADFFDSAYVPVIDADLEKLIAEGLYDESTMSLPNGVLLQVQSVTRDDDEIIIKGMKYRSGLGANGFQTKWTVNADGTWTMHDTEMTWIS